MSEAMCAGCGRWPVFYETTQSCSTCQPGRASEMIDDLRARAEAAERERNRLRQALEEATRALAVDPRFLSPARLGTARSILAAALAGEGEAKRCAWTYDETHFAWDSSCGEKWILMDGGPSENEIRFCHGCGKPVEVACEATPEKAREP